MPVNHVHIDTDVEPMYWCVSNKMLPRIQLIRYFLNHNSHRNISIDRDQISLKGRKKEIFTIGNPQAHLSAELLNQNRVNNENERDFEYLMNRNWKTEGAWTNEQGN